MIPIRKLMRFIKQGIIPRDRRFDPHVLRGLSIVIGQLDEPNDPLNAISLGFLPRYAYGVQARIEADTHQSIVKAGRFFSWARSQITQEECLDFNKILTRVNEEFQKYLELRIQHHIQTKEPSPISPSDVDEIILEYLNSKDYQNDLNQLNYTIEHFFGVLNNNQKSNLTSTPSDNVETNGNEQTLKANDLGREIVQPNPTVETIAPEELEVTSKKGNTPVIHKQTEGTRASKRKSLPKHQAEPVTLIFPPVIFLRKIQDDKAKRISDHENALHQLQKADEIIAQAEKVVRSFDSKKEPYVMRFEAIPEELLTELNQANDAICEANNLRTQAAQAYHRRRGVVLQDIADSVSIRDSVRPLEKGERQRGSYSTTSDRAVMDKQAELDNAMLRRDMFTMQLMEIVEVSHIDHETTKTLLSKLYNRDFDNLEKILPVDLEDSDGKPVTKREIKARLKELRGVHEEIVRAEKDISVKPKTLVKLARDRALEASDKVAERKKQYKMDQGKVRKNVFKQLLGEYGVAVSEYNYATSRYYRTLIENTSVDSAKFTLQREALEDLVSELQKDLETNKLDVLKSLLGVSYRDVRMIGQCNPTKSLTGKVHDPMLAIAKGRSSTGLINADTSDSESWYYRTPKSPKDIDFTSSDERFSLRVIADPELIDVLDEMSIKFNFSYKIPTSRDYWDRVDPVTLYCKIDLNEEQTREIAEAIQPFVFEGSDVALLGSEILDSNGVPYKGIRKDKSVELWDIASLVERAYLIDGGLGDAVSKKFDVIDDCESISCHTSPGVVESVRRLLQCLDSNS